MPDSINIVITINARDAVRDAYGAGVLRGAPDTAATSLY
jgi:hypothetical protein